MRGTGITGLGLVASGKRNIQPGYEFDNLYSRRGLIGTNPIIGGEWSDTYDTLNKMAEIVRDTLSDTKKVASKLKGNTLAETVENVWNHVYKHFQYSKDQPNLEQIRRPSRSWVDRKAGIDCDCMSVVISSLLSHLSIDHAFRKAAYKEEVGWQHVYVVVPKRKGLSLDKRDNYYVLDCVVDKFNYEVPFIDSFDKFMKIQYLNGVDFSTLSGGVTTTLAENAASGLLSGLGSEFSGLDALHGLDAAPEELATLFMMMLKQHLINTRKIIALNPTLTDGIYDPATFTQRLDYLIASFDDAGKRNKAVGELAALEDSEEVNGLSGHGLGKGFFKKVGSAIKKVAKVAVKTVTEPAKLAVKVTKKVAQAAGKAIKAVAKFVVRFNPATIAIRNGVLLAMKLNLFRLAEKLGYGFWSEAQAKEKGLDINEFRKAQRTLEKVRKIHKGLGGKVDKFDKAVKHGWEKGVKKHNLVHGLEFVDGLDGKKRLKNTAANRKKLLLLKKQQRAKALKQRNAKPGKVTPANARKQAVKTAHVKKAKSRIKSAMPLLQMVNAQLKPVQYTTLLRKTDNKELDQFYQSVRTNKNGIATKLSLAYKPVQEAGSYNKKEYAKLLQRVTATEKLVTKRGGSVRDLREAIDAGKKVAINSQGIGEPVTAASTAAASGVLAVIGKLLKSINFSTLFKGRSSSPHSGEEEIKKADVTAPLDEDIDDEGEPNAQVVPFKNLVDSVSDEPEQSNVVSTFVNKVANNPIAQFVRNVPAAQALVNRAVQNSPVTQALVNQIAPTYPTVAITTPEAEPVITASGEPVPDAYANSIQVSTPSYATPGIVPYSESPSQQNSIPVNSGYQEAQVVSTKINTPEKKDNTVKYIAIAGGVGVGLLLLSRMMQSGARPQATQGTPPQLSGVKKPERTSKKESQRTHKKVMAITV